MVAIGCLSGYFVGVTGNNVTVIAAIVTAVTAAAGGAAFSVRYLSDPRVLTFIGILLIVYSSTLFFSAIYSFRLKENYEREQLFASIDLRGENLRKCSEAELRYKINDYREKVLGLQPLQNADLCR